MSKQLTRAEEQVMQILWGIGKGYLKSIIDEMPAPKPHSNTVATILKILLDKGFVDYEVHGRVHCYFPLITKSSYSDSTLKSLVEGYFQGSFSEVVSFMIKQKDLTASDLQVLLSQLKKANK